MQVMLPGGLLLVHGNFVSCIPFLSGFGVHSTLVQLYLAYTEQT